LGVAGVRCIYPTPETLCAIPNCATEWVKYFNSKTNNYFTSQQIANEYFQNFGRYTDPCGPLPLFPTLCDTAHPQPDSAVIKLPTPCDDVVQLGIEKGTIAWKHYRDSLNNEFECLYLQKCMAAGRLEKLTVTHSVAEYHYTLYYYDRAGNLGKTVPPAGVITNYTESYLNEVKTKRATGIDVLTPYTAASNNPAFATNYRYNTLGQVVAQKTPDAGLSSFWYDRLGRLVLSQNAKQATSNLYSYTLYDFLGRITEVGEKQNPNTVYPTLARNAGNLQGFISYLETSTYPQKQVTRTVYDEQVAYSFSTAPSSFVQKNYTLRNRVSYTQYLDEKKYNGQGVYDPTQYNTATYYNFDIHGNVKQLLNDYHTGLLATTFSSNRVKLIEYDYDLISGKVNSVAYQKDLKDQFYHRYGYDAENRLTDLYTTNPLFAGNSYLENHDAKYNYYKHGPLARMILGSQQVQGGKTEPPGGIFLYPPHAL